MAVALECRRLGPDAWREQDGSPPDDLDWSEPIDMTGFYRTIFRPALHAAGRPRVVLRKVTTSPSAAFDFAICGTPSPLCT